MACLLVLVLNRSRRVGVLILFCRLYNVLEIVRVMYGGRAQQQFYGASSNFIFIYLDSQKRDFDVYTYLWGFQHIQLLVSAVTSKQLPFNLPSIYKFSTFLDEIYDSCIVQMGPWTYIHWQIECDCLFISVGSDKLFSHSEVF